MFSAGWRVLVTSLFLPGKLCHTLQGFSLHYWKFPIFQVLSGCRRLGCMHRGVCCGWFLSCSFADSSYCPLCSKSTDRKYSSLLALRAPDLCHWSQRELQQVVFSEATQTTLFFLAKIYPYFLWFRSGAVTHTHLLRECFFKSKTFFLILLQHENLKFWTVYFEVEKSKFLVLLCYIVIEISFKTSKQTNSKKISNNFLSSCPVQFELVLDLCQNCRQVY